MLRKETDFQSFINAGSQISHRLSGTTLELDWTDVFDAPPGTVFIVYVGSKDGAANILIGGWTNCVLHELY